MHYLIINPYKNANHGIANYINNLREMIGVPDEKISIFANDKNLSPIKFRESVRDYVTSRYGYNEVVIEAPEAKAATLLLPKEYKVHIRLHCPLAIAQYYDGHQVNQVEFSHELRVINKAKIVSSPSYGLLKELSPEIIRNDIFVYKNPILFQEEINEPLEKDFDVVFMGRYQPLKGSEELNQVLQMFPEHYKVLVFGGNCRAHKLSPNVKCDVTLKNEIRGNEKFRYISRSRCLIQLSRFENCSMVILEAISCHVPVVCWDVGGNAEIASRDVLHPIEYLDFSSFAQSVEYFIQNIPDEGKFESALNSINNDFKKGFTALVQYIKNEDKQVYLGLDFSLEQAHLPRLEKNIVLRKPNKKIRVLGIGYSNEHIEELWAPVISYLDFDVRYICRRPKGFHSVFKHEPFPVQDGHYTHFNWMEDLDRLEKVILSYKPNLILFHNGLHPSYQDTLSFIKSFKVPIVYSELGWFPQKDHVYFDALGVNAKSYIATQSFESFTNTQADNNIELSLDGEYALLALQLENDTNLLVSSPDFKNNLNIIKYVNSQIGSKTTLAVKAHPLDRNYSIYKKYCQDNNILYLEGDIKKVLSKSHSVIAVNSTVLLEALDYPCNIYALGDSILNNKGILIDCRGKLLGKLWKNKLFYNQKNRRSVVAAFKDRQINLLEIRNGDSPKDIAVEMFFKLSKVDVSFLIQKEKLLKKEASKKDVGTVGRDQFNQDSNGIKIVNPIVQGSSYQRKLNKFKKHPLLFIKDMFLKNRG